MILETDRLLLREMTLSDLDVLLLVLGDAESMRYSHYIYAVQRSESKLLATSNLSEAEKSKFKA